MDARWPGWRTAMTLCPCEPNSVIRSLGVQLPLALSSWTALLLLLPSYFHGCIIRVFGILQGEYIVIQCIAE
jgi:hypothetical protein